MTDNQQDRYRFLFENMQEGFFLCEILKDVSNKPYDFRYLDANPVYLRYKGQKRGKLINHTSREVDPSDPNFTFWLDHLSHVAESNKADHFELVDDGNNLFFEISAFSTEPGKCAVIMTDISKRVKSEIERQKAETILRESEEKLRLLIEHAPVSLSLLDNNMEYLAVSRRWIMDYNLREEDFLGKSHYEIFPEINDELKDIHRRALQGEVVKGDNDKFIRQDGSVQWLKWEVRPWYLDNGLIGGIVIFSEDISERKKVEDAVRNLNTILEQRVSERTSQLEAVNNEMKSFAYSVAHDLRSPLRAINGWSSILSEDFQDRLDEKGKGYLSAIKTETSRMDLLIDGLLRLSRASFSEIKLQEVNLSEMAQVITSRMNESEKDRQIELMISPGMTTIGDVEFLEIALTNLFSNALKFTSHQPVTRIEFGQFDSEDQRIYYVQDNGVGFNQKEHGTKLFGAFQRLHKDSEFSGLGIGLTIVERIIHRHGGKIWAESEMDKGAIFYFTLGEAD